MIKWVITALLTVLVVGCESYHVEQNSRNSPTCSKGKKGGLFNMEECKIVVESPKKK